MSSRWISIPAEGRRRQTGHSGAAGRARCTVIEALDALGRFDVVLSDMAPHTTGIRDADVANSIELVDRALVIAGRVLVPGGKFLAKVFQGSGFEDLRARMRPMFENVRLLKPEASKRDSTEIYLAGLGKKP